jgi:hypothetical protein
VARGPGARGEPGLLRARTARHRGLPDTQGGGQAGGGGGNNHGVIATNHSYHHHRSWLTGAVAPRLRAHSRADDSNHHTSHQTYAAVSDTTARTPRLQSMSLRHAEQKINSFKCDCHRRLNARSILRAPNCNGGREYAAII